MAIELPKLPYALNALEPHISSRTLEFHHGKHHKAYVDKTNSLIAGTDLADKPLEELIAIAAPRKAKATLFNNAAQAWNHNFLWHSMTPNGGGRPQGAIAERIERDFKSYDAFAEAFKTAAVNQFGSGWAWLVLNGDKVEIVPTANADTPIAHGKTPLLTVDVWEHAYYLDYQNRRPDYVGIFLEKLVNWDFANQNLSQASRRSAAAE
ncbi:MAG: superoxide dismutase, Fe-Mn family [Rhodospirillaceae bacterium]|jgi:Fe-Mn family superoxide dismutase|nr:superoxide dismutase, Fe-Mn family [Rhodospirillaceae bacterium]